MRAQIDVWGGNTRFRATGKKPTVLNKRFCTKVLEDSDGSDRTQVGYCV